MAYTPELSDQYSATLRRIAWALDLPMTVALQKVFDHIAQIVDRHKVCGKCKDKSKCIDCLFNGGSPHA